MSLRCAWCHETSQPLARCAGCGTRLHPGCWDEAGECPTLGCPHRAQGGRVMVAPAANAAPSLEHRLATALSVVVLTLFGSFVGLVALAVIGERLYDWVNAPVLLVRNETGRTLRGVEIRGDQPDAGQLTAQAASWAPGDTLDLRGTNADYELNLSSVAWEGSRVDVTAWVRPGRRAAYSLSADGRLRDEPLITRAADR